MLAGLAPISRNRFCEPTLPECHSSGLTTARRCVCITPSRLRTTAARFFTRCSAAISQLDGRAASIDVNSIIATHGTSQSLSRNRDQYVPPLNNRTLFKRDANLCLYCGDRFMTRDLTRDHITPVSQGGRDKWNNVAAACRRCNNYKGGRTPEQAAMQLIAVPFTPNYAEYIYLKGRRVLTDQMQYLLAHIPRSSPLHKRLSNHLSSGKVIVDVHFHD